MNKISIKMCIITLLVLIVLGGKAGCVYSTYSTPKLNEKILQRKVDEKIIQSSKNFNKYFFSE